MIDKTIFSLDSSQTLAQHSDQKVSYELLVYTTWSNEQNVLGQIKNTDPNHDETDNALELMANHDEIHTISNSPAGDIS